MAITFEANFDLRSDMNRSTFSIPLGLIFFLLLLPTLRGQQTGDTEERVNSEWKTLKSTTSELLKSAEQQSPALRKANAATSAKAVADQFRDFRLKYPTHLRSSEARYEEAYALNRAAMHGDMSDDERRKSLLEGIRKDTSISTVQRFRTVAWSQQVAIARAKPATTAARLSMYETAAKALIAEFPSVSDGYESLYAVARDSDTLQSRRILSELLGSSAPESVKAQGRKALARLDLIGRNFNSIYTNANISLPSVTTSSIVYVWSVKSPSSIRSAKYLSKVFTNIKFIGICLDNDAIVGGEDMPGIQVIAERRHMDNLINSLSVDSPTQCFVLDAGGVIRDLGNTLGVSEKIKALAR